jgi:hypothetical protein
MVFGGSHGMPSRMDLSTPVPRPGGADSRPTEGPGKVAVICKAETHGDPRRRLAWKHGAESDGEKSSREPHQSSRMLA